MTEQIPVGTVFAGFRIEAILGRGGMGAVYRARDLRLDHERALKILDPGLARDATFRERFQRESQMAAAIEHDAVVPVYQAGEEDGRLFIVMRLVRGPDLHRLVVKDGPLEPGRASRFVAAVAGALDAAHRRGTVHRDVKPANVLVELGTEGERVFLSDFGIGRPAQQRAPLTSTGELLGTVDYIAPEQIEGHPAEPRSDVYALGCVACFLLTGEPPFRRETDLATLYAHANAERPRPSLLEPGLPSAVDDVIARATAVSPDARHASAGAFAEELSRATRRSAEAPTRRVASTPPTRGRSRRFWLPLGIATILAAAAVAAILLLGGKDDETRTPGSAPPIIGIGDPVDSVVVGELNVLLTAHDASALYAVDPETNQVKRGPVSVPRPTAVTVGFGSVWVASGSQRALFRFGPPDRKTAVKIPVGEHPADVAVSGRWVWVANEGDGTVSRVDPYAQPAKAAKAAVELTDAPSAIAAGEEAVWVASPQAGTITPVDPRGRGVLDDPIEIGGTPTDLALGEDGLWVVDERRGTLTALSPDDGSPLRDPVEAGEKPVAVATGLGAVWVADSGAGEVLEIDPASGQIRRSYAVGKRPTALSVGPDAVWVANTGGQHVSRITP